MTGVTYKNMHERIPKPWDWDVKLAFSLPTILYLYIARSRAAPNLGREFFRSSRLSHGGAKAGIRIGNRVATLISHSPLAESNQVTSNRNYYWVANGMEEMVRRKHRGYAARGRQFGGSGSRTADVCTRTSGHGQQWRLWN